jgi:uncharacterized protein (TIGR02145 family)
MAENLDYGTRVDSAAGQVDDAVAEKFCVDDCQDACAVLGGLYTHAEALALPSACNNGTSCGVALTAPHQGLCPDGWHVPDIDEWALLESTVEGETEQYWGGTCCAPLRAADRGFSLRCVED